MSKSMVERVDNNDRARLRVLRKTNSQLNIARPKTRGECQDGVRPCPWVSCRHHLAYEVTPDGDLRHMFPGVELGEMQDTCSLDVSDRGPSRLVDVVEVTNISIKVVQDTEDRAIETMREALT